MWAANYVLTAGAWTILNSTEDSTGYTVIHKHSLAERFL